MHYSVMNPHSRMDVFCRLFYIPCRFLNPTATVFLRRRQTGMSPTLQANVPCIQASSLIHALYVVGRGSGLGGATISREGRNALKYCFSKKGGNREGVTLALGTTAHLNWTYAYGSTSVTYVCHRLPSL